MLSKAHKKRKIEFLYLQGYPTYIILQNTETAIKYSKEDQMWRNLILKSLQPKPIYQTAGKRNEKEVDTC